MPKRKDPIFAAGDPTALTAQAIADLRSGLTGRFWKTLSAIIQANVDFLSVQILEDEDLTEAQRGQLRKWRNLNKELVDLPGRCIQQLEAGTVNPLDLDPYFKTYKEMTTAHEEQSHA